MGISEMLSKLSIYYIDIREITKKEKVKPTAPVNTTGAVTSEDNSATASAALDATKANEESRAARRDSIRQEGRRKSVMSSEMSSARGSGTGSDVGPQSGSKS